MLHFESIFFFRRKYGKLSLKDSGVLFSNFVYLSLLQLANYFFHLLTMPYLARIIGVNKFGEIAFAQAVIVWFQAIVDYGFLYSAVRDIARCKQNLAQVSSIYSNIMWSRLLLLLLSFIFLVALIILIPIFYENRYLLLLTFLVIIGYTIFPDWLFQAFERMKYVTLLNVLTKLLFTIAVFVFIKKEEDYLYQPLLIASGYFISGLISLRIISKWGIHFKAPNLVSIFNTLKANSNLFINQIVPNLYTNMSVVLLGLFYGERANGILDVGRKFDGVTTNLIMVLSRTFYPYLSRNISKHNLFLKLNLLISLFVSIILFVFAPSIIKVFLTGEFSQAVTIIRILSISIVFISLSNVYGTNFLIVKGYEKEMRNITLVSSFVGLFLAIPCIYYYSFIGAAIIITLSRGLMALLIILKFIRLKNEFNKKNI